METSKLFNILTLGFLESCRKQKLLEIHRQAVMTEEEAETYTRWQREPIITPEIGASFPCPLDLKEIDARTSRPAHPAVV